MTVGSTPDSVQPLRDLPETGSLETKKYDRFFSLPSKKSAALALFLFGAGLTPGFAAGADGYILHREAWSFNCSELKWFDPGKAEQQKRDGTLGACDSINENGTYYRSRICRPAAGAATVT